MSGDYRMRRGWMDHPALRPDEPYDRRSAWAHIVENARFRDGLVTEHGTSRYVLRGQYWTSNRTLAKALRWDERKVRRFLEVLQKHSLVGFETAAAGTLITVVNYEELQNPYGVTASPSASPAPHLRRGSASPSKKEGRKEGKEGKEREASLFVAVGVPLAEAMPPSAHPPASLFDPTPPRFLVQEPAAPDPKVVQLEPLIAARKADAEKPKKRDRAGKRLPADWQPNARGLAFASERGHDPAEIAAAFRDYWHSSATPNSWKIDWDLAFLTWVRKERPQRQTPARAAVKGSTAWMDEMADRYRPSTPQPPSNPSAPGPVIDVGQYEEEMA